MQKQSAHIPDAEPVIALTHVYDAPRALVWEVFTTPEHLQHWWGPDGFSIEHDSADIRTGGYWKFVMVGPDGTRWDNYHQFTDVSPMDSITHLHGAFENDPGAFVERISFIDRGAQTEVTMHMTFPSLEARANVIGFGADRLGQQTLAKAEAYMQTHGLTP